MSDFKGLKNLMNKSLSIAVAALSSIQSVQAKSLELPETMEYDYTDSTNVNKLKPKLVLKLNMSNPDEGHMLLLHTSHSSHRSHSSHSSHSSHYSSSYSSGSGSNYPTQTTSSPIYTPSSSSSSNSSGNTTSRNSSSSVSKPIRKITTPTSEVNTLYNSNYEKTTPSTKIILGDRELYKGCQGSDVEQLQKLLAALGYDIIISEYFGDRTEKAVISFQKDNELKPDGRVSGITLLKIKLKS